MNGSNRHLQHADTLLRLLRHARSRPEDIARFQERKLRFLAAFAYERVPFYRDRFDAAGIRPEQVKELGDLPLLPRTVKADRRAADPGRLIAGGVNRDRLVHRFTTGSTGEPTHIYRTTIEDHLLNQFRLRSFRLQGQKPGDVAAVLLPSWGRHNTLKDRAKHTAKSLLPGKRIVLECMQPAEGLAAELAGIQPDIVRGLPGVLAEVASAWPKLRGNAANPRLLVTSGEALTPNLRRTIEQGFSAAVLDSYGAHEFNLLAWECPQTGLMHVCDDSVILEVLHDGVPAAEGEAGEVVVTGLHNHASPYIRYEIGDIAVRGPERCPCGAPFSTLVSIRGRTADTCVMPDGRRLHHWELIPLAFWDMPWMRRYQLVQKTPAHVILRVIASSAPPAGDIEELERGFLEHLGPEGRFEVEYADEIAFARGGKHRACISEVGATN